MRLISWTLRSGSEHPERSDIDLIFLSVHPFSIDHLTLIFAWEITRALPIFFTFFSQIDTV
jgi:hypothetical protein